MLVSRIPSRSVYTSPLRISGESLVLPQKGGFCLLHPVFRHSHETWTHLEMFDRVSLGC